MKLIDEIDCTMQPGKGDAADLATLTVPHDKGVRVLVVGDEGVLFEDYLPFNPDYSRIGHHTNGFVITGFGAVKMNYGDISPRDFDESARIYLNGRIMYEGRKIWDFDIKDDGASFAVHEAVPVGTSKGVEIEERLKTLTILREHHFKTGSIPGRRQPPDHHDRSTKYTNGRCICGNETCVFGECTWRA